MSEDPTILEARVRALEITVDALIRALTILDRTVQQAQEMSQPASSPMPSSTYATPHDPERYWPVTAEPSDDWFPVMHLFQEDTAVPGCGNVAYYVVRKISLGEKFDPAIMRVQGSDGFWGPPQVTEVPRCSSCRMPIDPRSPADLDFSQARTFPPTTPEAPESRARKPRVNTRRSRPAQEVRVSQPLARPGGGSSPGPSDLPPEPTLPAAFTPEAQAEIVDSINRLAKEMGLHG